jgi:hypothetical protein
MFHVHVKHFGTIWAKPYKAAYVRRLETRAIARKGTTRAAMTQGSGLAVAKPQRTSCPGWPTDKLQSVLHRIFARRNHRIFHRLTLVQKFLNVH